MFHKLRSHMRHNVVAYLALFFALSGSAIAAKPLITGADVQDGSLTGADVAPDSLTGDNILESSLGKVPTAGNADTLGGKSSTDFLGVGDKAADSDKLDGIDSTGFLGATAKAADSDKLDGKDSSDFLGSTKLVSASDTEDPPSIAAHACYGYSGTATFARGNVGDPVFVSNPYYGVASISVEASSARAFGGEVTTGLLLCNWTDNAIDPPSATFKFVLVNSAG